MMSMSGSLKLKTKTTMNLLDSDVFNGRMSQQVQATRAASRMASMMHTAFSRAYTCGHCWPTSFQGWEGSHCSAAAKTAPTAQRVVAMMMPYAIRL